MLVNMDTVLLPAKKNHYGVGLFNAVNLEMNNAIMDAAESLKAPVIVGTAEILLGAADLKEVAAMVKARAEHSDIPVVLHYDHGLTFEKCKEAIKRGIAKINIFTEISKAQVKGMQEGIAAGVNNAFDLTPYEVGAIRRVVEEKMTLFGSVGKV